MPFYLRYFPLIFWHTWQVCWPVSFLELPFPASRISEPQDYTSNYWWQRKKLSKYLAVQSSTKNVGYVIPCACKRKCNDAMTISARTQITLCIIITACVMLFYRSSHPTGFVNVALLKSLLWKETHVCQGQRSCKSPHCLEWDHIMEIQIGLCSATCPLF